MTPERALELDTLIRKDLENLGRSMEQQKLMGGMKPEHFIQIMDIKLTIAISGLLAILEANMSKEDIEKRNDEITPKSNLIIQ